MSDYNGNFARTVPADRADMSVDAGLRSFMLGVYNKVALGLLLSAALAFLTGTYPPVRDLMYQVTASGIRMTMLGIVSNKPLLMFPIVKAPDLVIARAILEIIAAFCVFIIFILAILPFVPEIIPPEPATAMMALFATIYFAIAFGFVGAVLYALFPIWLAVQIGLILLMYFSSGALFNSHILAQSTQDILWFNPLYHCVEWMRSAYYLDYGDETISRTYLLAISTVLLMEGLVLERLTRGKVLMQ